MRARGVGGAAALACRQARADPTTADAARRDALVPLQRSHTLRFSCVWKKEIFFPFPLSRSKKDTSNDQARARARQKKCVRRRDHVLRPLDGSDVRFVSDEVSTVRFPDTSIWTYRVVPTRTKSKASCGFPPTHFSIVHSRAKVHSVSTTPKHLT